MIVDDFLVTVAALVGRQVKVCTEHPKMESFGNYTVAMVEDVDLAAKTIKLEGHDPIAAEDVYTVTVTNPDFTKRSQRDPAAD